MAYVPGTEVANFPQGSQFEGGESAFLCVFFGCADIAASSQNGYPVGQPWEWVDQTADRMANEVQGAGAFKTSQGASLEDEYSALQKLGPAYAPITVSSAQGDNGTINRIKQAINNGTPVLLCGAEEGFIDVATGQSDYTWTPTGNHCIVVSGYSADGNLIVRDYAETKSGIVPGSKRTYSSSQIRAVSATAVVPYWHTSTTSLPGKDWSDNGTTLKDPGGHEFVLGNREYILTHKWDEDDWAIEEEHSNNNILLHNSEVGKGTSQCTKKHLLWWTDKLGVNCEPFMGWEIYALQQALQQKTTTTTPATTSKPSTLADVKQALQEVASAEGLPVTTLLMQLISDSAGPISQSPSSPPPAAEQPHPPPPLAAPGD